MGRYATMETVLRCLKAARDLPVTIEANGLLVSSSLCSVLRDAHAKVVFLQDGYPNSTTLFANSLVLKEMGMDATFRASLDEERAETLVPWMWLDTLSNAGFTSFEYTCQPTLSPFLFRSFLSALFSYWHAEKPVEVKVPQLDAFSTIVQGDVHRGACIVGCVTSSTPWMGTVPSIPAPCTQETPPIGWETWQRIPNGVWIGNAGRAGSSTSRWSMARRARRVRLRSGATPAVRPSAVR